MIPRDVIYWITKIDDIKSNSASFVMKGSAMNPTPEVLVGDVNPVSNMIFTAPTEGYYKITTEVCYDFMHSSGSIVIRLNEGDKHLISDIIPYDKGTYKRVGDFIEITVHKNYENLPLRDVIPTGFSCSEASLLLYGVKTYTIDGHFSFKIPNK